MKPISEALAAHLAGQVLTICTLWKLTRQDGVTFGFTDHDTDLTYDGVLYAAATGYTRSAIRSTSGLSVDQLDLEGLLEDVEITIGDLQAGRYDHATVDIYTVNWADLSMGVLHQRRGWLGNVTIKHGTYIAELRGLSQALSRHVVELVSPDCRADLGDARCTVDLEALKVTGSITAAGGRTNFHDTSQAFGAGYFDSGVVHWTGGANAGLSGEIKTSAADGGFLLWLPTPYPMQVGDTYEAWPGCDKRLQTCRDKYDNVVNFRGEPFVVGADHVFKTPDAKVE